MPAKKKRPSGTPRGWSTSNEIEYLDSIGRHSKQLFNKMSRLEWLNRYRKSMDSRVRWDTINPNEIAAYIERETKKLVKA